MSPTAMNPSDSTAILHDWPEESKEAAELVIDTYGRPHEATSSLLRWFDVGPWKRIEASRQFHEHRFPVPHIDSVESFLDYDVPVDKVEALARFDGSVVVDRTIGEVFARCHDEQANLLALNLAHELVAERRTVDDAREHYAREFLDVRRGRSTPYMDGLAFGPSRSRGDPDTRVLSDEDLERAQQEGDTDNRT